jgi:hypothetical protein
VEVKHLLLDLVRLECRLASFALAGGNKELSAELLSRAFYLLRLRDQSRAAIERGLQR